MKEWLRFREKAFYRIVNAGLLVCMVLFCGGSFSGMRKRSPVYFITVFAALGVLAGINYMTVRGRILCSAIVLIILCAGLAAGSAGSPVFPRSLFLWMAGREAPPEEWKTGFELLRPVLVTVVCYLIQILFEKLPLFKAGAAFSLLGVLIYCLLTRREQNHIGMAFALCFLLMNWQEWVQRNW